MVFKVEPPRIATVDDAQEVAELIDRFNREFETPSPGPAVLTARLKRLLAGHDPGQMQPQLYYHRDLVASN